MTHSGAGAQRRAGGLSDRLRGWITGRPASVPVARLPRSGSPLVLLLNAPPSVVADFEASLVEAIPDMVVKVPETDAGMPGALPLERGRRAGMRWLEEHDPSLVVWFGDVVGDTLLDAVVAAHLPVIAVDVPRLAAADMRAPRSRRAVRTALGQFVVAFARDNDAARSLRSVAPAGARIEALGPVRPIPMPPPCSSAERDAIAASIRARPVWLAAFPDAAELPAVLAAHRQALRGAHRLLLIVALRDETAGSALAADLREEGWRVARRGAEGEPDDTVEIFVADTPEEIGLWYRVAPTTYLGGTLSGGRVADPAGPATLGSAIVVGPHWPGAAAPEANLLERLSAAGGLLQIPEADALAAAVSDLQAPDRAAVHAHAAWETVSDSARVLSRVVSEVRASLRAGAH